MHTILTYIYARQVNVMHLFFCEPFSIYVLSIDKITPVAGACIINDIPRRCVFMLGLHKEH